MSSFLDSWYSTKRNGLGSQPEGLACSQEGKTSRDIGFECSQQGEATALDHQPCMIACRSGPKSWAVWFMTLASFQGRRH